MKPRKSLKNESENTSPKMIPLENLSPPAKMTGKISTLIQQMKTKHPEFALGTLGGENALAVNHHDLLSTGIFSLDKDLGGGFPFGRIVEIFGAESSGKTTLCLQSLAQAQKEGLVCAYIDAEHALDTEWATLNGVDLESLLFYQPNTGEEGLNLIKHLLETKEVRVIIMDSVAALTPQTEAEGDIGSNQPGRQAKLMSQAMRILAPLVANANALLICINQIRNKIGVMYGSPITTPGGEGVKFASSVRIEVRRAGSIGTAEDVQGVKVAYKIVKNKVAPPMRSGELTLLYHLGFDVVGDLVDVATDAGILKRAGAWYSYNGSNIACGREAAVEHVRNTPELLSAIKTQLLASK